MHFPSSSRSSLPASLGLAALGLVSLGLAAAPARAQTQDLFVSNQNNNTISRFAGTGLGTFSTIATTLSDPNGTLNAPRGLVFDTRGDLFAANSGGNSITEFAAGNTSGTLGAGTVALTGGGLNLPRVLVFDTRGDLFAANVAGNSITEFAFNPASGTFGAGAVVETGLSVPRFLAFGPSAPPAVPEASTTVSLGLLLALGLGGTVMAARKKRKA